MIGRKISHYLIERPLGSGGMGDVYLARDLALARPVALKLLQPSREKEMLDRFLQEARLAARLQHPSIVTFYEAGESEGTVFLAMEYVAGATLRERLAAGPLPPEQALGIVAALLEGLVHAHSAGVLHRDIKPENILVTGPGAARLLDFGIAKQMVRERDATVSGVGFATHAGVFVGTPGYVSPEQIRGQAVDERSDVFAVGAVLFEALSGRPAFPGNTIFERIGAVFAGGVPPLEPTVRLEGVDVVLARALELDPERRHPSASAFLRDLEDLAAGRLVSEAPDTLAVVDLDNTSGVDVDAWIGTAVAEDLTGELAQVPGLQVVARERVLRARAERTAAGKPFDALEIARALGCRWLVSGGFQKIGPRLRITSRLTEVASGRVAASQKLDGALDGFFEMQDALANAVVAGLPIARETPARARKAAPHVSALEFHATGSRLLHRLQKGSLADAMRMFESAIEADPRFAPPYAGLSAIHALQFTFTTDRHELERAEEYGRRAIELDGTVGGAHVWVGYSCWRLGRTAEALAELDKARRLMPDSAYGHYFAGCTLWSMNRDNDALAHFQRAVQVDAQHGFAWLMLGSLLGELGEFREGEWSLGRAIELEGRAGPGPTIGARGLLGELLRREGRLPEARKACMEGIIAAERSDHMYRDTFRAVGLLTLGRVALDQGDTPAARAAFIQAATHLRGRSRTLGGKHFLAQALAGGARAGGGEVELEAGLAVHEQGADYDDSWFPQATRRQTVDALVGAAAALGRRDVLQTLRPPTEG